MSKFKQNNSEFRLEGWLLGFVIEDGYKIKYLRLATSEGECQIKLAKEARISLFRSGVTPGTWVEVFGETKLKLKSGEVKQKAYLVKPGVPPSQLQGVTQVEEIQELPRPAKKLPLPSGVKATILVCKKSDCCKLGANKVCQALEEGLRDRGLDDQVTIKGTGCMKRCKSGPNIVMPDKTRYTRINATEIPEIIDKHFPDEMVSEELIAPRLECETARVR
ncbi:(2Fe-2S) ferredoxin domain-containing protein [Coleofasciculus sp. FACHB-64]|uniref:(2Fe-2S) ferredoxin domain-containing protein n=1 Tax=Cyanophyceae TaxID=3028117 RepID=UPI0016865B9A|nr:MULTISPECIES: (2Fe-2S) ferredoxin domain-containing protein [unclassified Coleofasciculus]MBD1881504.1 (2Fe-2S) ferredoxin domain-containing protein [Coleofasciculus sp. FACHB-T130]MBD1902958.1 (2Fe-2S) ferredoxin domain-containing protein [Coleofasciculus sp. FACHB-125]MBD2045438.1 (2Fe-2S) ferredoxin domain-containing protein [Coleofasciculus sp. FACHB-64]